MRIAAVIAAFLLPLCAGCGDEPSRAPAPGIEHKLLPLTISTPDKPVGREGTAFGFALVASGGTGRGHNWAITGGALPPGTQLLHGVQTSMVHGTPATQGEYSFTVEVTDSAGNTAAGTYQITILPFYPLTFATSQLPVAVIGTVYQVVIATNGGTGVAYQWTISAGVLPPGFSFAGGTPDAQIVGTPTQPGSYSFILDVTDSLGETASETFVLDLDWPLLGITTATLPAADTDSSYLAHLTADGGTGAGYQWGVLAGALPAGIALVQGTPVATLVGQPTHPGVYAFTVQVVDSAAHSATAAFVLHVGGAPPLQLITTALPATVEYTTYTELIEATGGTPPYTWTLHSGAMPPGLSLVPGTPAVALTGTSVQPGNYQFTVRVTDARARSDARVYTLDVLNAPPLLITTAALPAGLEQSVYSQVINATGGSPPYTWSVLAGSLPPGLSIVQGSPAAGVQGTPALAGVYSVTVQVADVASRTATRNLSIVIDSPVQLAIATPTLSPATEDAAYSEAIVAVGGVGPYAWGLTAGSLPPGISLAQGTPSATLLGTPLQSGSFTFVVEVTDALSRTETRGYVLDVIHVPPLVIVTQTLPNATEHMAYAALIQAAGGTPPYAWRILSGTLPQGISLTPGTPAALLQGSPAQPGSHTFIVELTDSAASVKTAALSIIVDAAAPVRVATETLPTAYVQTTFDIPLDATGGAPPYLWDVTQGGLPPGLTIVGSRVIGTPAATGQFGFTLRVRDSGNVSDTRAFTMNVGQFGFATEAALPFAVSNHPYSLDIQIVGANLPLSNWQITAGAMAPGLTLESQSPHSALGLARLSGVPTVTGTHHFTIQAVDASARVASRAFTLEVRSDAGPLAVVNHCFGPWGTASVVTDGGLTAAGVSGAVTAWSVIGGALPPGVTIAPSAAGQWELTGRPTLAGTYTFTLEVEDSAQFNATRQFVVEVDPPNTMPLVFGVPVRPRAVFVVATDTHMAGAVMQSIRAELSRAVQELPAFYEFDIVAFGSLHSPQDDYCRKLWGSPQPANAANRAHALGWIQGTALDTGGVNTTYTSLRHVCANYPADLLSLHFVSGPNPGLSGGSQQIAADLPGWLARMPNCYLTVFDIGAAQAGPSWWQSLCASINAGYVAS